MEILETTKCVFRVKQLVKYSSGLIGVRILTLNKDLKKVIKIRVFTYKYFGDAFNRYKDGDFSAVRKYSRPVKVSLV